MKIGIKIIASICTIMCISCSKVNMDYTPMFMGGISQPMTKVYLESNDTYMDCKWLSTESPIVWNLYNDKVNWSANLSIPETAIGTSSTTMNIASQNGELAYGDYISLQSTSLSQSTFRYAIQVKDSIYIWHNTLTMLYPAQNFYDNLQYTDVHVKELSRSSNIHLYAYKHNCNANDVVDLHYQHLHSIIRLPIIADIITPITKIQMTMYDKQGDTINCVGEYKLVIDKHDYSKYNIQEVKSQATTIGQYEPKFKGDKNVSPQVRYYNLVVFSKYYYRCNVKVFNNEDIIFDKNMIIDKKMDSGIALTTKIIIL